MAEINGIAGNTAAMEIAKAQVNKQVVDQPTDTPTPEQETASAPEGDVVVIRKESPVPVENERPQVAPAVKPEERPVAVEGNQETQTPTDKNLNGEETKIDSYG